MLFSTEYSLPSVDVSAVRDLCAVVKKEGASRGILVTTSTYGADAYAFANNEPVTLLNGAELLGLLMKHGYALRINLQEARRFEPKDIPILLTPCRTREIHLCALLSGPDDSSCIVSESYRSCRIGSCSTYRIVVGPTLGAANECSESVAVSPLQWPTESMISSPSLFPSLITAPLVVCMK